MYKIMYDDAGNIFEYTKVMSHSNPALNSATVTQEFTYLFEMVDNGKLALAHIKVDVESKDLSLINLAKREKQTDPTRGKLVSIPSMKRECELNIIIKSIDSRPHLIVNSSHSDERKFFLYLTRKSNINYLYQSFECDTNVENVFEIDQIDYRKLFSTDFSLYYKKIFNSAGYTIQ